jgi:hypothetical protein
MNNKNNNCIFEEKNNCTTVRKKYNCKNNLLTLKIYPTFNLIVPSLFKNTTRIIDQTLIPLVLYEHE